MDGKARHIMVVTAVQQREAHLEVPRFAESRNIGRVKGKVRARVWRDVTIPSAVG